MSNENLCLLKIRCKTCGAVFIDGVPAGEINSSPLTVPACPDMFIQFFPFGNNALPITLKLLAENDSFDLSGGDCVQIIEWPNGILELILSPYVYNMCESMPYIIKSLEYRIGQYIFNAMLYFDRTVNFAIEDSSHKIIFAYQLTFNPEKPSLSVKYFGDRPVIFAEIYENGKKHLLAVHHSNQIYPILFDKIEQYRADSSQITVLYNPADCGGTLKNQYKLSGNKFEKAAEKFTPNTSCSRIELAKNFTLCVKYSNLTSAYSMLSDSLKNDISADDLKEFLGDFVRIENFGSSSIALIYKKDSRFFYARTFTFTFDKNEQISNIEEN